MSDEKAARLQAELADWLNSPHTARVREQARGRHRDRLEQLIRTCHDSSDPKVVGAWNRYNEAVELVKAMENGKIG